MSLVVFLITGPSRVWLRGNQTPDDQLNSCRHGNILLSQSGFNLKVHFVVFGDITINQQRKDLQWLLNKQTLSKKTNKSVSEDLSLLIEIST